METFILKTVFIWKKDNRMEKYENFHRKGFFVELKFHQNK